MFLQYWGRERRPIVETWAADDELMQNRIQRQYAQQSHDEINVSQRSRCAGFPDAKIKYL